MTHFDITEFTDGAVQDYQYDGLIQEIGEIKAPSEELATQLSELITDSAKSGYPVAFAGAYVYERKGYFSTDTLSSPRNSAYGLDSDDVILQITVRIPSNAAKNVIALASAEHYDRTEQALKQRSAELEAQKADLEGQIAALEAQRAKL